MKWGSVKSFLLFALVALLAACAQSAPPSSRPVAFEEVEHGKWGWRPNSGPVTAVVRTRPEWQALRRGGPHPEMNDAYFSSKMVIGVIAAGVPNSCTGLSIVGVTERAGRLQIDYEIREAHAGDVCMQAFFQPYDFVSVKAVQGEVDFHRLDYAERGKP